MKNSMAMAYAMKRHAAKKAHGGSVSNENLEPESLQQTPMRMYSNGGIARAIMKKKMPSEDMSEDMSATDDLIGEEEQSSDNVDPKSRRKMTLAKIMSEMHSRHYKK